MRTALAGVAGEEVLRDVGAAHSTASLGTPISRGAGGCSLAQTVSCADGWVHLLWDGTSSSVSSSALA